MPDEILTPEMADALHRRALDLGDNPVWIVAETDPGHPGVLVARLIPVALPPCVLTAQSRPELGATLPSGLKRSERQPAESEGVLEVWVSEGEIADAAAAYPSNADPA